MSAILGMNCKLYRNTGTYANPVWSEIGNVRDCTLGLEDGEVDATTRANNGYEATETTLRKASLEFEMVFNASDAGFAAIKDAFFNKTGIECAAMTGDIEADGSEGLRATWRVTKFSMPQNLNDIVKVQVSMKPGYSENAPEWMVVEEGS